MKFLGVDFVRVLRALTIRRKLDQGEGRIRKLVPDLEIVRGHRQPAKCKHVTAGLGDPAGPLPGNLVDHFPVPNSWSPSIFGRMKGSAGSVPAKPLAGPKDQS